MAQLTYTTLDGEVLDLTGLDDAERAFIESMIADYRGGADWGAFARRASGDENPALEPGARVTRAVLNNPLFRAVDDMEGRLAIAQGILRPGAHDDPSLEPFEDDWVSVYAAAADLGITAKAAYKAIDRGDLVANKDRPARVSRRSVDRYQVSQRHVTAGQQRGEAARARA